MNFNFLSVILSSTFCVVSSSLGHYTGVAGWVMVGFLIIENAVKDKMLKDALKLAQESNDGWKDSLEFSKELITKM
jgi:hypothetical protein